MARGKVWLVGAGPGDIGLLTLKAKEVMEKADLIAYDALISDEILCSLPEHAEKISVGKRSGRHSVPQDETNRLLVRHALEGKNVVRLKGGDPFVFGRGGEELEQLEEYGIEFEVVPGVTSAAAVPAYAGIPLTHRDFTSSFHVITGHPRKDGKDRINYKALVQMDATLVFLMGVCRMEILLENLIHAGMDINTPAAVIERGTRYDQRKIVSTVSRLYREAQSAGVSTPAVIVIGKVCALADRFSWYEKMPLSGRQIIVTQPANRESILADRLRAEGAEVLLVPAIETKMLDIRKIQLSHVLEEEKNEIWLIFTSRSGVDYFFQAMELQETDLRELFRKGKEIKFAAVGNATAERLRKYGWKADLVPSVYSGGMLGKMLAGKVGCEAKLFWMCAAERADGLVRELGKANTDLEEIPLYETMRMDFDGADIIKHKIENNVSVTAAFTSAYSVKAFAEAVERTELPSVTAVCIGRTTAEEAGKYKMNIIVSEQASIGSMVEKIKEISI